MKRVNLFLLFCVLGMAISGRLPAAERIAVARPLVSPEGKDASAKIDDLLDRSAAAVNRLYGDSIRAVGREESAEYTLATVASLESDTATVVITLSRVSDGAKSPPLTWYAPSTPDQPLWLARAVYLLWSSFHGFPSAAAVEPPALPALACQ